MVLLSELHIVTTNARHKKIQLYNGDLTQLQPEQDVDLLVVSAFPDNYEPTDGTLIGALHQAGLSVEELAHHKSEDMRTELGCWFSDPLEKAHQEKLHVKRILCFEPLTQTTSASEVVGNIFRCLNNFIFDNELNHIAMPIVASGNQNFPLAEMCDALLDAAIFWLQRDLPLDSIKLVHKNPETISVIQKVFVAKIAEMNATNANMVTVPPPGRSPAPAGAEVQAVPVPKSGGLWQVIRNGINWFWKDKVLLEPTVLNQMDKRLQDVPVVVMVNEEKSQNTTYDVFISYSHKQKAAADGFVRELRKVKPSLKIFYDDNSIPKGAQWLKLISEAIDASRKVVIFVSPEYTQSKICWDEFQCAKVREYNSDVQLLITIYLKSHDKLPTIFQLNNWIDCRESDEIKIKAACNEVLASLEE